MFTGIIESVKPVKSIIQKSGTTQITLARPEAFTGIKQGSSIACNGICLTVIDFSSIDFTVEVMQETLQKSNAAKWAAGEQINLERALALGDRLDGHWVQGHIDTTTTLLETKTMNATLYLTFALPAADTVLVVPQGSIAINGVSLTISALQSKRFTVALIGHTITNTNLPKLSLGNLVNLEYDILGKYLLRQKDNESLSLEKLYEQGF